MSAPRGDRQASGQPGLGGIILVIGLRKLEIDPDLKGGNESETL
jgi:hypothetical protein